MYDKFRQIINYNNDISSVVIRIVTYQCLVEMAPHRS